MKRTVMVSIAVALVAGLITMMSAAFVVDQREQALVLRFGDLRRVIREPGLKFKVPFIEDAVFFDKRLLDYDNPGEEVIGADQKRLVVDAFARFHIVDPLLFYQTVGTEALLKPRLGASINSNLRRVLGTVPLQDVVSERRASLMALIRDSVREEATDFGIRVEDVRIRRADLPQENSEAIYRRMQTEREQEAAQYRAQGAEAAQRLRAEGDRKRVVIVAEADRDAQILRGEGEAESNRLFAEAFSRDPEFFAFYRSMQAYQAAFGGEHTTMVLSPDSDFFSFFRDLSGAPPAAAGTTGTAGAAGLQ